LVFSLAVGLLFAACGDSDDVGTASPDSTTTTSLEATTSTSAPTSTTVAETTTTVRETLDCESIAFTPNSEDGASDVTATGLSCEEAEAFVRIAGQQTSSGGPDEVDVEGFHCARVDSAEDPLPFSSYECTSGSKVVTFTRS
jgi:hypothetical protein